MAVRGGEKGRVVVGGTNDDLLAGRWNAGVSRVTGRRQPEIQIESWL